MITNNRKPYSGDDAGVGANLSPEERQKLLALRSDAEGAASQIIAEGGEALPVLWRCIELRNGWQAGPDGYRRLRADRYPGQQRRRPGLGHAGQYFKSDWDYQTVPKLKGAYNTMRQAVPYMLQQKFGRVINVASDAWIGMNGLSAYSAANAGLVGLTKATAKELFRAGVTVNAICPQAASPGHYVEFNAMIKKLTAMGVKIDEARMKKVEDDHGPAEDMAPFVAYLATDEAAFISGAVFSVTASGRVALYSEPAPLQTIQKDGSAWTVEELIQTAPESLFKDYTSIAAVNVFG